MAIDGVGRRWWWCGNLRFVSEVAGGVELLVHGAELFGIQSGRMCPPLGALQEAAEDVAHSALVVVDTARTEQRFDVAFESFHPPIHLR